MKKILNSLFFILLIAVTFSSCKEDETVYYSMNRTDLSIHPKETYKFCVLEQSLSSNNVYSGGITWSVEDVNIATIDNTGLFTAVASGETLVKALLDNGKVVISNVTVNDWSNPDAAGLVLDRTEIYQPYKQTSTDTLKLSVSDDILEKFDLKVTSSDEEAISPELIAPSEEELAAGNKDWKIVLKRGDTDKDQDVEIKVFAGETYVSCIVHIGMRLYLSFDPIDLSLSDNPNLNVESSFLIKIGQPDTIAVNYVLVPDDPAHIEKMKESFKISSEGNSVLMVEGSEFKDGKFYVYVQSGNLEGNTSIIIEALGNKVTAQCSVVDIENIVVNSVEFDMDGIKEMIGQDLVTSDRGYSLFDYVSVDPISATVYWPIQWTSSDTEIATIISDGDEAGTFTIKKAGVFTITATCKDKSASVTITSKLELLNVTFANNLKTEFIVGEEATWSATVEAKSDYSTENVVLKWTSSDENIATVTQDGKVTAVGSGKAQITVSAIDDFGKEVTAVKEINVRSASDIEIDDVNFSSSNFMYIADIAQDGNMRGSKVQVFNEDGDNYDFRLYTEYGTQLDLSSQKTLTFGVDFISGSKLIYPNGENPEITEGTIDVLSNGDLQFNLKAQKAGKEVSITGDVKKY